MTRKPRALSPAMRAIVALLDARAEGATICPSEAARALDAKGWRARMEDVREAAQELAARGMVDITQRGRAVSPPFEGPIRIRRRHDEHEERGVLTTPDGRYIVVRGRLWRRANPSLPEDVRAELTRALMEARRDVGRAKRKDDDDALADARRRVQDAKVALGERGPVWWTDGAPDENRRLAKNTRYAAWYRSIDVAFDSVK